MENIENIKKISISWDKFHKDTKALCNLIKQDVPNIEGIIIVSRGGIVPAGIISYELNVKNFDLLSIESYNNFEQKEPKVIQLPEKAIKTQGKNWVVIDELLDGGTTIKFVNSILPESNNYVVYSKIKEKPSYLHGYVEHTDPKAWIYLPWDL